MTDKTEKTAKPQSEPAETAQSPAQSPAPLPAAAEGLFGVPSLFDSMQSLRDQMDRMFQGFASGWPMAGGEAPLRERFGARGLGMLPKVETAEDDKAYEITVELPGVDQKDVTVSVDRGALIIRGEKKSQRDEKKKDYHLTERSYGSFERSFYLPETADKDKVAADFANGVLTVTVPKAAGAAASERKVPISKK